MDFTSYYRKLTEEERGGKPWKYELVRKYTYWHINLGEDGAEIENYIYYGGFSKALTLFPPYRWNGSNVVEDTDECMAASAGHDAMQQLINEGKLDRKKYQDYIDRWYRDRIIKDAKEILEEKHCKDCKWLKTYCATHPRCIFIQRSPIEIPFYYYERKWQKKVSAKLYLQAWKWRANFRYTGLRLKAAWDRIRRKK